MSQPRAWIASCQPSFPSLAKLDWPGLYSLLCSFPVASTTDKWLSPRRRTATASSSPPSTFNLQFSNPLLLLHLHLHLVVWYCIPHFPRLWNFGTLRNPFEKQQPASGSLRDTHSEDGKDPGEPVNHHAAYASLPRPRNTTARRLRRPASTPWDTKCCTARSGARSTPRFTARAASTSTSNSDGDPTAAASLAAPSVLPPRILGLLLRIVCPSLVPGSLRSGLSPTPLCSRPCV